MARPGKSIEFRGTSLADLRDLLSQLAEPDFEPPKGKPSGSKGKG